MKIDFTLDAEDYLAHQLYVASRSQRIRKKRIRNKFIVPVMYILFAALLFLSGNMLLAMLFFVFGGLWFALYPLWEKKKYLKHYSGFINENYKEMFGRNISLVINDDHIQATEPGGEGTILTSELKEINEIQRIIMLRFAGGQSLILPKNKISEQGQVTNRLKELSTKLKIPYTDQQDWEWK